MQQQTNRIKVLVVDDEPNIVQFLTMGLANEGYQVFSAADGDAGLAALRAHAPHIVILDVMMPGMDGFEACKRMKEIQPVAIIMLTAREETENRVRGLHIGADDYMAKPFSFEELLARIHARIRNQFPQLLEEVGAGPYRIDDRRREIRKQDRALDLSPTEYELLKLFILHHGVVLSKSTLLERVWGYDFGGEDNIVEVYVRSLRDKIEDREHQVIRTIRGAGYRMDL